MSAFEDVNHHVRRTLFLQGDELRLAPGLAKHQARIEADARVVAYYASRAI